MKVSTETKFNIGSLVYVAEPYYEYYPNKMPYIVAGISIHIKKDATNIIYYVEQNGETRRIAQGFLFDTYEECKKWCEEHN